MARDAGNAGFIKESFDGIQIETSSKSEIIVAE
jgi:hypothetical protein